MSDLQVITPEQHRRDKYIGGSDIAGILNISPWKDAVDVWADKITPRVNDEQTANHRAKQRGSRLEPYIRDMIQDEHGIQIEAFNQRYIDSEVPYFAAEIDFETAGRQKNGEIKTVHPFAARDWGEQDTDELPLHYVAQVQWGMGITRRQECEVFALIGDDLRRYTVHADQDLIDTMRERAKQFWECYVLPGVQPPLDYDNPARALETLKRLYPGTNGQTIDATPMHEHWRKVIEEASRLQGHYQNVIDGAKAHLLSEMGNAALLRFQNGRALRRKQTTKKPYTVEGSTYIEARFVNLKEDAPK